MALRTVDEIYGELMADPGRRVVIDAEEAAAIWMLFRRYPKPPNELERLDYRAFLQAALMAAIDASAAMGYIEVIFRSTLGKPAFDAKSFRKLLEKLGKGLLKQYFKNLNQKGKDLMSVQVYQATVNAAGTNPGFKMIAAGLDP
jgi:hypothetical protein